VTGHRTDIRTLRIEHGLRQADLARQARVSASSLRKWERGLAIPPKEATARLAAALGVPARDLERAQRLLSADAIPGEGYTTRPDLETGVRMRRDPVPPDRLRILDLFCGSGGFSYGFESTTEFAVTAGIDLLPDRIATFEANHPFASSITADIRQFPTAKLEELAQEPDAIIGGPPCQGFSSIRPFRTYTEGDARNNLYEFFAMAVARMRPRWFVLENVLGLLTHRKGESLRELMQTFKDVGYRADFRVINAALFGLPQNRERLLIVGSREGKEFRWPSPTHRSDHQSMAGNGHKRLVPPGPLFADTLPDAVTVMEAIHDLPEVGAGESSDQYKPDVDPTPYEADMRSGSTKLTLHQATGHSERMLEIIRHAGANRYELPPGMVTSGFSSCYSRLDADRPAVTLTVNFVHPASNRCIHPYQDRALTPREGARLQSFPDRFHFEGTRSQIVKQIGNAVPPLLGQTMAQAILDQW